MTLLHHNPFNPWRETNRFLAPRSHDAAWIPAFDIEETDAAYVLRGDVPGTSQKDIEIRIEDGVLSVRGERKASETDLRFRRAERLHGGFERRFRVPNEVDADGVKATYTAGVLEITLPKSEAVDASRLIPVS